MSRFDHVKYDDKSFVAQKMLKTMFEDLEAEINECIPDGRGKALALTKLEEAYMWCGKGIRDDQIARNGSAELQEERNNE
jgi:hypothetical protein